MKIFDAMILKREIGTNCHLNVKITETLKDGLVLRIMENKVNKNSLEFMTDFVKRHKLNILLDNGVYFISTQILSPCVPNYLAE